MNETIEERRLKDWAKPIPNGYISNADGGGVHRDVWRKHHGEIPKGYVIHHKNFNKKDNRIENLQCISYSEHIRLHKKFSQSIPKFV